MCSFLLYSKLIHLYIHIHTLFYIRFHYGLPQNIEYGSLYYKDTFKLCLNIFSNFSETERVYQFIFLKFFTFMNLHTGGGIKSCRISEWVLMSVATTNRLPSTSSPNVQMSIDKEAKSPQVGINTSVNSIGLPKSKVTNLLAPIRERESNSWHKRPQQLTTRYTQKQFGTFILKYKINLLNYRQLRS